MARQRAAVGARRFDAKRKRWLRWSGGNWAPALYSRSPDHLREPTPPEQHPAVTLEQRRTLLGRSVDAEVLAGASVVRQSDLSAVLDYRRPISHTLHLLLTLLTAGLWGIVWIVMAVSRTSERRQLAVDEQGHVWMDQGATTA